jgi:hypothetical protein
MKLSFSQLAVEALRKRERQDETQFFSIPSFNAPFNANVLFLQVFWESHPM